MSAQEILRDAADTFEDRRKVYGDNYKLVGAVMAGLFPEGITLSTIDDHNRFHIFMLEVVKLTRYAQNWQKGGHADSQLDLAVYAAMLNSIDEEINGRDQEVPL